MPTCGGDMRDPLTLRILGLLLLAAGAAVMALGYLGYIGFNYKLGAGAAAALGALLIVFSAFYRRGRHGLTGKVEKRTGKPSAMKRLAMFWGGAFLVIISPLVGVIPGPGGIVAFGAGFGLMLRGSRWVKKHYARFKRRHPKKGDWPISASSAAATSAARRASRPRPPLRRRRPRRTRTCATWSRAANVDAAPRLLYGACLQGRLPGRLFHFRL
jgi:hypothetical protein